MSILVLHARGIGRLLTAVPALRGLRKHYPSERLVLAAPIALVGLVPLLDCVDELLPTNRPAELKWPDVQPPLLAVNLHGPGAESIGALLAQGPGELISHQHPGFPSFDGPPWQEEDVHEVDRWCGLLEANGIHAERGDLTLPHPPVDSPAPGAIVIHPGAGAPAREWPAGRYATVARELAADGYHVVVTGSPAETELAGAVADTAGIEQQDVLAGRTELPDLAGVVADARLVICGDTGVGHLATAYGTPSVLLFGPRSPALCGPLWSHRHLVLWAGIEGDPDGGAPALGLMQLHPDLVLEAARSLLVSATAA